MENWRKSFLKKGEGKSCLLVTRMQIEYDAYQDDKFGRILEYAWIPCIRDFIAYCRGDKVLVNEIMIKKGYVKKVVYEKRKKLKYDA